MKKNAIVLMFDSLQFNYLGCYGNDWIKTPNMDRLAREGALFENSYTEGLPTVPCRRAMHTGRYTVHHSGWVPLSMEDTTIADLCWGKPIDTALIFDCPMYRLPKFGYTRSFDKVWFTHGHEADHYYFESDELIHLKATDYIDENSHNAYIARMGEAPAIASIDEISSYLKQRQYGGHKEENRYVAKTITNAIKYLEQIDRNKQFYLWIDSFDPHEPWDPPSVYDPGVPSSRYDPDYKDKDLFMPYTELAGGLYTEPQLHHIRMLYAELVTLCDKYLGKLLDKIEELGLDQNTLFMMVSDHGEPMGHGEHGHGLMRKVRPWPYEELVHTPLLIKGPGIKAGQRLKGFVQSCDVAPTVCDWLGIGRHPDMHGHSLLPMCFGEVEKVRDFAVSGYFKYSIAIYTDDWSYIHWQKAPEETMLSDKEFFETTDGHLKATGGVTFSEFMETATTDDQKDASERHKAAASVDGADQWTCTPGTKVDVPARDELYDRKNDPFQLNNLIDKNPDVAKKLFDQVREFMTELKVS